MVWQGIVGLLGFSAIAWVFSENRRNFPFKFVVIGIAIQLALGWVLLKVPLFNDFFLLLNRAVLVLEKATTAGTSFVFGYLGGGTPPFEEKFPGAGFILAFRALPLVLVMSALSAVLFYWRILPWVVRFFSWALQKSLGLGGTEGLGVSANVFVGMVEAPLLIRPYLERMSRSELFTLMTSGMATIAGTVMVLYASILSGVIPNVMGHILTASVISVPAAVVISKIMIPETEQLTAENLEMTEEADSTMDALTKGTLSGAQLLVNIIAMLIVLVAVVYLVNAVLSLLPDWGGEPITLQKVMGVIMAPLVWMMGISWHEAFTAGSLMGTKTILNELLAYLQMSHLPAGALSPESYLIMTYAMCGFANPGSLGIMIGGLGTMAPARRSEIVSLGFRSIVAGTLATSMTGSVVAVVFG